MANVLKISEAASLALHSMVVLAGMPDQVVPTRTIADRLEVSEAHLSKVLQRLTRQGLVTPVRGPRGGFILGQPAEETTLLDVFEAIEGPIKPEGCMIGTMPCRPMACMFGGVLEQINLTFRDYLNSARLSELAHTFNCENACAKGS